MGLDRVCYGGFIQNWCLLLLIFISTRTTVLGYLISLLVAYNFLVKRIRFSFLVLVVLLGYAYSYGTNIWRGIVSSNTYQSIGDAQADFAPELFLSDMLDFSLGTDLSDIRVFILIEQHYGRVLPYEYGSTIIRVITQLIPRAIWSEKPLDLGIEIGGLYLSEDSTYRNATWIFSRNVFEFLCLWYYCWLIIISNRNCVFLQEINYSKKI